MGQVLEDLILFAIFFYVVKNVLRIAYTFLTGKSPAGPSRPAGGSPFGGSNFGGSPFGGNGGGGRTKPEGSIDIKFAPEKKKSSVSDKAGEFIDYEEIKPKK